MLLLNNTLHSLYISNYLGLVWARDNNTVPGNHPDEVPSQSSQHTHSEFWVPSFIFDSIKYNIVQIWTFAENDISLKLLLSVVWCYIINGLNK